jgi:hypothetical protein
LGTGLDAKKQLPQQLRVDAGNGKGITARTEPAPSLSASSEEVLPQPPPSDSEKPSTSSQLDDSPTSLEPPSGPLVSSEATLIHPLTLTTILAPKSVQSTQSLLETLNTPTPTAAEGLNKPRGVTLVDHPLALPHHQIVNSSRFSFEGSSKAASVTGSIGQKEDDGGDGSSFADGSFQFGLDDDMDGEDDGFERANEGMFHYDAEADQDQLFALHSAVEAMNFNIVQEQHGIGMAISGDGVVPYEGHKPDVTCSLPSMNPKESKDVLNVRQQLANPRGYDLSDDSDLDFLEDEQELAGYEDDDDMYFTDGLIDNMAVPVLDPPSNLNGVATGLEAITPEEIDDYTQSLSSPPAVSARKCISISTSNLSSGGIPQDGSMNTTQPETPISSFPPFINPVGGGLGYTPQQHQFYNPNMTGTLDGMDLSTLTYSLQQLQRQQQQLSLADVPQSPSEGYDSDINEQPNFGTAYDSDFDAADEDVIAAANAEALASDYEGFYGSEFGFYQGDSGPVLGIGGSFGDSRPPIRKPSLTPISERSECSYRNSLVFPVSAGGNSGGGGSWGTTAAQVLPSNIPSPAGDEDIEVSLGQLLQLRRNAWGGSNGSIRSSGSGGAGGSPVAASPVSHSSHYFNPNWPPASATTLTAVGMGIQAPTSNTHNSLPTVLSSLSPQSQNWPPIGSAVMSWVPPPTPSTPLSIGFNNFGQPPAPLVLHTGNLSGFACLTPPGMDDKASVRGTWESMNENGSSVGSGIGCVSGPPGLTHAGNRAMLPTKGSFEDPTILASTTAVQDGQ